MTNIMKTELEEAKRSLDNPIDVPDSWSFLKKNKLRVMIIFEDKSYRYYYKKLKENYTLTIQKKTYIILPECIVHGKKPMIVYYFNNPFPVNFKWHMSKIQTKDLFSKYRQEQIKEKLQDSIAETRIDAQTLSVAFSSNLINKMYSENRLTTKSIIIILIVVVVVILIILQATGKVDVIGWISGRTG